VLGPDGDSDLDAPHSRKHDKWAQLYVPFTCSLAMRVDCRPLPLSLRKANLARPLRRRVDGFFPAEYDAGEIAYDLPANRASKASPSTYVSHSVSSRSA
jgi:bifunctional non-homologous end joining protein LigD